MGRAPHTPSALRIPSERHRTAWIDGIRFAAALFVVLHHIWLLAYPAFPRDSGPTYLGWLLYGHLAVVVFIVVSGYSLTLAPARNGLLLKGGWRNFARRRAWRILPPYWAALVLSMFVVIVVVGQPASGHVGVKSFVVHFLLLQDIIGSTAPNGTFWSIAVEAQIYVLFPLILIVWRRYGATTTATIVTIVVCVLEVAAHRLGPLGRYDNLTPQLLVDFTLGMIAAGSQEKLTIRGRTVPLLRVAFLLILGTAVLLNRIGSVEAVKEYFWVDLLVGLVTALAFRGLAAADHSRTRDFLQHRPLTAGGRFSYSIYLVHALVIDVVGRFILLRLHWTALSSFWLSLVIVVPTSLVLSYAFFIVFEKPYLNARSIDALPSIIRRPIEAVIRRDGKQPASASIPRPSIAGDASVIPDNLNPRATPPY